MILGVLESSRCSHVRLMRGELVKCVGDRAVHYTVDLACQGPMAGRYYLNGCAFCQVRQHQQRSKQ